MSSSLQDHEEICAQRYEEIDRRMTSVEEKIDKLGEKIDANFKTLTFMIIGAMAGVGTLVGVIVALLGVM
jgi:hypothetical protein